MENMELREIKRELYKEIDELKREHKAFKKRVSVLSNLIVPGIGFLVYGSSFLKGFISFILFVAYNLVYFNKLLPLIGEVGIAVLYYIPAIVIWFVSAVMVAGLDD